MSDEEQALRAQLKQWEKAFALRTSRKPCHDDIKSDPTIANKYKQYARLKSHPPQSSSSNTPKRKRTDGDNQRPYHTPIAKTSRTPITTRLHPSSIDPYDSPFPLRQALGPTPQRDGKALGLFDLLASSPRTPKASRLAQTPRKSQVQVLPGTPSTCGPVRRRYASTPLSSARKFYLASFAGEPRRCVTIPEEREGEGEETPAFLRRKAVVASVSDGVGPKASLFGAGISSFARRLKEGVEEGSEDETVLDTQLEKGEGGIEGGDIGEDDEQKDAGPVKVYRKKGQKRTTKISRLRPSRSKPAVEPEWETVVGDSEDELGDTIAGLSDHDEDDAVSAPAKGSKETKKKTEKDKPEKKGRKIKAEAHANYRSLKIRSKGGQKGGRFKRR